MEKSMTEPAPNNYIHSEERNVEFPFCVGQKVKILPLDGHVGVVEGFWYGRNRVLKTSVRYFNNGELKDVYFYPEELEPVNGQK